MLVFDLLLDNKIDNLLQLQWSGRFNKLQLKHFVNQKFTDTQLQYISDNNIDVRIIKRNLPPAQSKKHIPLLRWDDFLVKYKQGYAYHTMETTFPFFAPYVGNVEKIVKLFDVGHKNVMHALAKSHNLDITKIYSSYHQQLVDQLVQ